MLRMTMLANEDEDGPYVDVLPSGFFREELTAAAVDEFGSDGAWLLLSILSYGWRTFFDLGHALAQGPAPEADGSRPEPVDEEFQIVKDLQVQSLLYSAAEQFAGLVRAARAHETGTSRFFDTYVEHKTVGALISDVADLEMEELENLLGVPRSVDEYPATFEELGSGIANLDPGSTEVEDVGGLLVPRAAIRREAIAGLFDQTRELAVLILTNIQELRDLVEAPKESEGAPAPQPLREVDNAFRHGHRVLFHRAVPETRRFRVAGPGDSIPSHSVDLYMPKGKNSVHYATVFCSPERTAQHLEALRQVCLRSGQFVRGFVGWKALGNRDLFAAAVHLGLGEEPDDS